MLNRYKELTDVKYGNAGIRYLCNTRPSLGEPAFLPHWHERMELMYVEKGAIDLYLDEVLMVLREGQLGIIPPEVLHGGICREAPTKFHTFMFEVERFQNGTGASEEWLRPLAQRELQFPGVLDTISAVEAARQLIVLMRDPNRQPLVAVGQLYILLGELCRVGTLGNRVTTAPEESFRSILAYIDAHYTEPLSVREISRVFSYNETYFCRLFKKKTGLTVLEYIRILRLDLAKKLLKSEKYEIRDIAWKCGFPDESYFSRAFKAHTGKTPREFRNNSDKDRFFA